MSALWMYEGIPCIHVFIVLRIWLSCLTTTVCANICWSFPCIKTAAFAWGPFRGCIEGTRGAVAKEISQDRKDKNGLQSAAARHDTSIKCQGRNTLLHSRWEVKSVSFYPHSVMSAAFFLLASPDYFLMYKSRSQGRTSKHIVISIWIDREVCVT